MELNETCMLNEMNMYPSIYLVNIHLQHVNLMFN